jgi:hypothetical protein
VAARLVPGAGGRSVGHTQHAPPHTLTARPNPYAYVNVILRAPLSCELVPLMRDNLHTDGLGTLSLLLQPSLQRSSLNRCASVALVNGRKHTKGSNDDRRGQGYAGSDRPYRYRYALVA